MNITRTLKFLSDNLNENKLYWTVGGSALLQIHGLTNSVNDIDIFLSCNEKEFKNALHLQNLHHLNDQQNFASKFFYKSQIYGVSVDFVGYFAIKKNGNIYQIPNIRTANINNVWFGSLEIWLCAYWFMNRIDKFNSIHNYLLKVGVDKTIINMLLKSGYPNELIHIFNGLNRSSKI